MDRGEQMALLSGVAGSQWGLVTAAQAKRAGLSAVQLLRLSEAGLIEGVGRGVYLVVAAGFPEHLDIKIAWLRLQPKENAWERTSPSADSGVVSHASACQLHELGDVPAPEVTLSVPRRRTTTEPTVRLQKGSLEPAEVTVVDGLPVTTATRTIVDLLRAKTDGGHVGGVIVDAERRDLIDLPDLAEQVQAFVRAYGLSAAASGMDLIEHLVQQTGQQLHAQDLTQANQQGFDDAVQLMQEALKRSDALERSRPGLPHAAYPPSLNDLVREATRMPSLADSIRKAAATPRLADILRASGINSSLNESVRKTMADLARPPRARAMKALEGLSADALRQVRGAALSHVMREAMRPTLSPSVSKALQQSASPSLRPRRKSGPRPASGQEPADTPKQQPSDQPDP
ncbi:type IV toxin-antitoxin system AbiEi family antitoxin domain-containing protein [Streptomyces sp. NPDC057717]|uniref:type IV toxin-antitoxin system AbiEi family antitoxin domain-containing protein n=1 Tax=Streptomyces sp. NPDC057717 TaxID=3346224 RepID=UPI0036B06D41